MLIGAIFGYFISGLIFGCIASHIAQSKGYEDSEGFWWGFFLGCVGLIIVACKPDQKSYYYHRRESSERAPESVWTCACGRVNNNSLQYCTFCRRSKAESLKIPGPVAGPSRDGAANAVKKEEKQPSPVAVKPAETTAPAVPENMQEKKSAAEWEDVDSPAEKERVLEIIRRLAGLYEQGVLTEEEFSSKKAHLLKML